MSEFPPARIDTDRLRLRVPREEDAVPIFERYASSAEVTRMMLWPPHSVVDQTHEFLSAVRDNWERAEGHRAWTIRIGDDPHPVGMIGLMIRNLGGVEIGYILAKPWWGFGIMTEAVRAVTERALATPGIFRVQATCHADNAASRRVLERAGFHQEGVLSHYANYPALGSEPQDCLLYARTVAHSAPRSVEPDFSEGRYDLD